MRSQLSEKIRVFCSSLASRVSERSEASNVSERSEASNVSERSEASNVSERSEASNVTGDFLWGYFLFSATSFFLPGGSRFFYPSHFFLLGDSECSP